MDAGENKLRTETRRRLLDQRSPRLQMLFILVLVGLSGLSVSVLMKLAGIDAMWIRYPLAVAVAYAEFFGCLWLWIAWNARGARTPERDSGPSVLDAVDVPLPCEGPGIPVDGPDLPFDGADELFIPIFVALLVIALACCTGWLLYIAPELLADVLVDAVLLGALYRNLKHRQQDHWTIGALRATWKPFTLIAVSLAAIGYVLQLLDPSLITIGDAVRKFVIHRS